MQYEFTNELRYYREDIQIICTQIANKNQTYFLAVTSYIIWDRVYFNGSWWNVDVTFDTIQTKNQGNLYDFCKIENAYSKSEKYFITKIY